MTMSTGPDHLRAATKKMRVASVAFPVRAAVRWGAGGDGLASQLAGMLILLWLVAGASTVTASAAASAPLPRSSTFLTTVKGKSFLNGNWVLILNTGPPRQYVISAEKAGAAGVVLDPSRGGAIGPFTVSGNTIVFGYEVGSFCKTGTASGKYSWSLSGKTLTLKKLEDSCANRAAVLGGARFTRIE